MALIDCHECGQPKSDTARTCPHCGVKPANWHRNQNLIAVGILIAIVVLAIVYGDIL